MELYRHTDFYLDKEQPVEEQKLYKCTDLSGDTVDLNDWRTYTLHDRLKSTDKLQVECLHALGHSWFYMDFLMPLQFDDREDWFETQRPRVFALAQELAENYWNKEKLFWLSLKFRILDEVENQC